MYVNIQTSDCIEMGKDFETMLQTIIADYLDGTLSATELRIFEQILNENEQMRTYVDKVREGSLVLHRLDSKSYDGPYIHLGRE